MSGRAPQTRAASRLSSVCLLDVLPLVAAAGYGASLSPAVSACRETWTHVPRGLSAADAARVVGGSDLWRVLLRVPHGRFGATRLMWAAATGRASRVETLLSWGGGKPAAARASPVTGWTPLMYAAGIHAHYLSPYAAGGAFSGRRADASGSAAALRASRRGRRAALRALLAAGADARARDRTGLSALLAAAADRHGDACDALVAAGADVDAANSAGWTPLMAAATRDGPAAVDTVARLLAAGADPRRVNGDGWCAFEIANAWGDDAVAALLNSARADG